MKPLSSNLKYILPKIKEASRLLLFLDYDGTLAPIARRPEQARFSPGVKSVLKRLSRNKRIILSIVSGRSLSQIRKMVGLRHIYYAGNHGLEIGRGKRGYIIPQAEKSLPLIRSLKEDLSKRLKPIKSAEIEDKKIVLAVHYRRTTKRQVQRLKKLFFKTVNPYLKSGKINLARGKKVLEIRPPVKWDKGRYCFYLLKSLGSKKESSSGRRRSLLPVYIGDDITDETAFRALRRKGITIFVKGEKKASGAEYYLNSTREVTGFLNLVVNLVTDT